MLFYGNASKDVGTQLLPEAGFDGPKDDRGRRWDAYRGGRTESDLAWWLGRLALGRNPCADERFGQRPGLFGASPTASKSLARATTRS